MARWAVWQRRPPPLLLLLLCCCSTCHGKTLAPISSLTRHGRVPSESGHAMLAVPEHQEESDKPALFFEVAPPVMPPPPAQPCASLLLLRHSFANTTTRPPATATYTPPLSSLCGPAPNWHKVVLQWTGSSRGRQYDRIAAVWVGGVEVLRTCTAEPTPQGIVWNVYKDLTPYSSLLASPQLVVVELANVLDIVHNGTFHINLTLHFFSHLHDLPPKLPADLVLPISSLPASPTPHWFQIHNQSYTPCQTFPIPSNAYKALLEIYVSFHGDDEFWYTNPPNDYIVSNNLTGTPGNGPFREIQAFLDDTLVGAVWPFPVIYTGGIVNLFWRPAAAIGAFDLPTYQIDLSPFVGSLVDGKQHSIAINVTNAIGTWLIDANLHLWLDHNSKQTMGELLAYSAPPYVPKLSSHFTGLNGILRTTATRSLSFSGYVVSSMGNVTVSSAISLSYDNVLVFEDNMDTQNVSQSVRTVGQVLAKTPSEEVFSQNASYAFPLQLLCLQSSGVNNSLRIGCDLSHSLHQQISASAASGSSFVSLNNSQQAQGHITIVNDVVVAGLGALQQQYHLEGSQGCYARTLRTKNYTILHDSTNTSCTQSD